MLTHFGKKKRTERAAAKWVIEAEIYGAENLRNNSKFQKWLNRSQAHRELFDAQSSIWCASGKIGPYLSPSLYSKTSAFSSFTYKTAFSLCSAALLLFVCTFVAKDYLVTFTADYSSGVGETRLITLHDGSEVLLNTDTAINVDFSDEKRTVELVQGEAQFTVAKDPDRPFTVKANDLTATALGTIYSVRYMPDSETRVTVSESKVKIGLEGKYVILNQNESVLRDEYGLHDVHAVSLPQENAWQRGKLIFQDTPLASVIADLNRYFKGHIYIADDSLAHMPVNGVFDVSKPDQIIELLEESLHINAYHITSYLVVFKK